MILVRSRFYTFSVVRNIKYVQSLKTQTGNNSFILSINAYLPNTSFELGMSNIVYELRVVEDGDN